MLVFQLTLQGWQLAFDDADDAAAACIKWVKCSSRQVLDSWLSRTGMEKLVEDIDDSVFNTAEFEDGLDVVVNDDLSEVWSKSYGKEPINEWRQTCAACLILESKKRE